MNILWAVRFSSAALSNQAITGYFEDQESAARLFAEFKERIKVEEVQMSDIDDLTDEASAWVDIGATGYDREIIIRLLAAVSELRAENERLKAQLQTAREALEELLSYLAAHDHGPEGKCGYCIALECAEDALVRLK